MCDCDTLAPASIPYGLIIARAIHFASCLLVFGVIAFNRLVADPAFQQDPGETRIPWRPWNRAFKSVMLFGLVAALASGVVWYMLVVKESFWDPAGPSLKETARIVWDQTEFGRLSKIRCFVWLAAATGCLPILLRNTPAHFRNLCIWTTLSFSGALTVTLAWTGHGQEGSCWHLATDGVHLLISGLWPVGLLPFGLLLSKLRRMPSKDRWPIVVQVTRRFSAVSLLSVVILTVTGLVNTCFLVNSWDALFHTWYGRTLLAKFVLFCVMVLIGAANLMRHKPRLIVLAVTHNDAEGPFQSLRSNVTAELLIGALVIVAVAVLGVLPPAVQ